MIFRYYDYDNQVNEIEIPDDKEIEILFVQVLTGDETGFILFTDGSKQDFDIMTSVRYTSYDDGDYIVKGDNIKKWLNWEPTYDGSEPYARAYSYARRDAFDKED